MCVPVLKCRQLQGWGLCPLTPTAVADKNGGPRALRIEVGHGHAAPFLIDMFVYRMITPYCTKFDRLTNRKFMEIVGTRGQILMAKCTKIYTLPPSAPMAPRPSRLRRSSPRLRRLAPRSSRLRRSATSQRLKPTLLLPSGAATAQLQRSRR